MTRNPSGPTSIAIDQRVMEWLAGHRTGSLSWMADRAMSLGLVAAPVCVLIAILLLILPKTRAAAIAIGLAGGVASIASDTGKLLIERPRPPRHLATVFAAGYSFPSSAACTTMAVTVAAVALLAWPHPRWRAPGLAFGVVVVVMIGWAVMYLGAHWLTDVLAGYLLGALIGGGAVVLSRHLVHLAQKILPSLFPRSPAAD